MSMDVQLYRQCDDGKIATVPSRKTVEAAGFDLSAYLDSDSIILMPLETVKVPTGLHIAPPAGTTVLVVARSGLAAKGVIVANGPGVIDSDYRGEIKVLLMYVAHPNAPPFVIKHGDRIAQLLFLTKSAVMTGVWFEEHDMVESLRPSVRGEAGFGSTGR